MTVLEKEGGVGYHSSGRNSGVLHAGIYYGSDTLKARVCSQGSRMMQAFAEERNIPVRKSGKVIVATSSATAPQIDALLSTCTGKRYSSRAHFPRRACSD